MSKYRNYAIKGIIAGTAIALMALVGSIAGKNTGTFASTLPRDCDATSVINCGALSIPELETQYAAGGTNPHYGDLTAIYAAFGISDSAIKGLGTGATQWAWGQVRADGTVWMNGQMIGQNALTAGRAKTAHSVAIPGTGAYTRPPSDSFARPTTVIDMFIGFEGGKPAWGILTSCGNPLKWSKPHTTLTKQVADPVTGAWVKDATFTNGATIQYLLTVKNDGQAADTNIGVIDKLPNYQTFVPGSVKINNVAVSGDITSTGIVLTKLDAGGIAYITFDANLSVPATTCGVTDMNNIAREDSDKSPTNEDNAKTHTNVVCQTVKCDSLTGPDAVLNIGDTATFTANASDANLVAAYHFTIDGNPLNSSNNTVAVKLTAAGTYKVAATITPKANVKDGGSANCVKTVTVGQPKVVKCDSLTGPDAALNVGDTANFTANASDASLVATYVFTINGTTLQSTGNTTSVKLTAPGTYTIAAKVTPKAGVTDGGSEGCVKIVTVKENPVYTCDALDVTPSTVLAGGSVAAKLSYTAKNGATFKSATINFGDSNPNTVVVTNAADVSASHTYATAGTYSITVPSLIFTVNGQDVVVTNPAHCVGKVTVTEKPQVVTNCDALSASNMNFNLGESTTLTAQATAMNTTVTGYEFTVNGKTVQNTAAATYDFKPTAAGNYDVAVKVHFANGDVKGGTGSCAKSVCVTEVATPVYSCDLLSLSATTIKNGDTVTATVKYTAKNGATFSKAVINFGEASVPVTSATNGSFAADYTYKTAKNYTVTATVTFMVNGKAVDVTSVGCASKVTTAPTPPVEKCKIPGKEQYAANDTVNCNAVKGVTTLPNTGAGNMIGLFAAVTAAGAVLHNVWMRRIGNR